MQSLEEEYTSPSSFSSSYFNGIILRLDKFLGINYLRILRLFYFSHRILCDVRGKGGKFFKLS